jgi:hypothetical protein
MTGGWFESRTRAVLVGVLWGCLAFCAAVLLLSLLMLIVLTVGGAR